MVVHILQVVQCTHLYTGSMVLPVTYHGCWKRGGPKYKCVIPLSCSGATLLKYTSKRGHGPMLPKYVATF